MRYRRMTNIASSRKWCERYANDRQVGGDHYHTCGIQPWDAMESWMTREQFVGFLTGSVIKYVARKKYDRLEDLKKAHHCIEKLIEVIGRKEEDEAFGEYE